jgi:hypothetical protein
MKICWNNLEKLKYKNGVWYDKHYIKYIYKYACKNCGEPFLSQSTGKGIFCDHSCAISGKYNYFWGKDLEGEKNPNYKGGITEKNIPFYDTYAYQISYAEEMRRNEQYPNILEVICAYCGKWFVPKMTDVVHRIQALNGKLAAGSEARFYCSDNCKQECPIFKKSKWPEGFKQATSREVQPQLRQMCFERDDFTCQKCGKNQTELDVGLHCHHVEGIRWEPIESADLDKVITFCKNCHEEIHKTPGCKYHEMRCN